MMTLKMTSLPAFPECKNIVKREDFYSPFEAYFDQVFNDFLSEFPSTIKTINQGNSLRTYPKTDIYAEGSDVVVEALVPFVKKENLEVKLDGNVLLISGSCGETTESKDRGYILKEIKRSKFTRSFSIPEEIKKNIQDMDASLNDGVLKIVLKGAMEKPPSLKESSVKVIDIK